MANRIQKISRCNGCGKDRVMCVSVDGGLHFYCNRCGRVYGLGVNREKYYNKTPDETHKELFIKQEQEKKEQSTITNSNQDTQEMNEKNKQTENTLIPQL